MRQKMRFLSGIIAFFLFFASIPLEVFAAGTTLAITKQPVSQTIVEGKTVTFSITATGAKTYQWQVYDGSSWKNSTFSGNTTNKLTFTSSKDYSGYKFRCIIKDGSNKVTSSAATFKVLEIKTQPKSQTIVEGKTVTCRSSAFIAA